MKQFANKLLQIPTWLWVSGLYVLTHLPFLTLLPVFADEAIYIRWAQLIQDDAGRYLFFSMADGKPPLFIWLLSGVLYLFEDPLFAGRFLSLIIGLITVFVLMAITKTLTDDMNAVRISALLGILLPFWFFHHRMVLMDGLLTLCLAISFLYALRISKSQNNSISKGLGVRVQGIEIQHTVLIAISFAGAMMTKIPALFAIPAILITPLFFARKDTIKPLVRSVAMIGSGVFFGLVLFLSLRISPLFGALFSRGGDFTFSVQELINGEWRFVLMGNIPRIFQWISTYMTPTVLVFAIAGLFYEKTRKNTAFLLLCFLLFCGPLILVGRVLWPRYFLPSALFVTVAAALGFAQLYSIQKYRLFSQVLLALIIARSFMFMIPTFTQVQSIPFVETDRSQYLEEWSAGFGNKEIYEFVQERQALLPDDDSKKIVVLTEGSFGTLPDGVLMYIRGEKKAKNIEVHGIGLNIHAIPQEYLDRAGRDEVYYAVNSDRIKLINLDSVEAVFEAKRPGGKSLLFYKVLGE